MTPDHASPPTRATSPSAALRWALPAALLVTCGVGVWLRWQLTGLDLLGPLRFSDVKHAHSHLGYFGVLFPLLFAVWLGQRRLRLPTWGRLLYAAAVALSFAGFVRAGYVLDSIAGSTIVAVTWLVAAWQQRSWRLHDKDWMPLVAPGIVLASCCIPPIAVLTRRAPATAQQLVQTYLSGLLFLVAIPSLADALKIPGPRALVWGVCGIGGALFLGIVPSPWLGLGLVGMALLLQWQIVHMAPTKAPVDRRLRLVLLLWMAWTVGAAAIGVQLVPNRHHVAIGGLHFMLMGPILVSGWYLLARETMTAWLCGVYLLSMTTMCLGIIAQALAPHRLWPQLTAIAGAAVVLAVAAWLVVWWRQQRRHTQRGARREGE